MLRGLSCAFGLAVRNIPRDAAPPSVRYALVAGLCLTAHNLILIAADRLGQPLPVGIGISFSTLAVVGYLLHTRYTFSARRSWRGLARYTLTMVANLPLSIAFVWIFSSALAWPMPLASPVASVCLVMVNAVMSRWAILGGGQPGRKAVGGQTC